MTLDNRTNARVKSFISCTYGSNADTPRSGTVTSISVLGCFVKTKGWATKGQKMFLKLWLPEGQWLQMQGTVIYHMERVGFGVTFDSMGSDDELKIKGLVSQAQK
jgi:hypothetical protein